ncbi:uncharacterized protein LOC119117632 isoform X2 [Syngnathus acus]|uniref:uncharacterized protein LOC119117632 isoform X2 n=1 Tax=Syngnathus acus TaxID=161584 RepID=UPI001885AB97|nr:uncharacterized protein LOC119117632 isoform X2 [Syngnathus acus]
MEGHRRRLEECFLAKVGLAVAVAVIRGRSQGVDLRRHIQALSARLRESERTRRSEAEEPGRGASLVATTTASAGHAVSTESEGTAGHHTGTPKLSQLLCRRRPLPEPLDLCVTVTTGGSHTAKSFLVARILSEVSVLADRLCLAIHENASVDKIPVDNYGHALRLLRMAEELLLGDRRPASWPQVNAEQTASVRHLERQTLALCQEFPLFAVTVWRVAALFVAANLSSSAPERL